MADDNLVQQALTLLQQALGTPAPAVKLQTFIGTVIGVEKGDPFGTFWIVKFFDGSQLHIFQFGGPLPSNVTLGATLTLVVTPPIIPGGYSTLVSAQAAQAQ